MRLSVALIAFALSSSSSSSSSKLAFDLYAQLKSQPGNVAFSPPSVRTALAVTGLGARGKTATEIGKLVGADPTPVGTTTISFGPDIEASADFVALASKRFGATGGSGRERGIVIANEIAFHGSWKTKFNENLTRDDVFFVDAKHTKHASMMHLDETVLAVSHGKDADVIALPYEDGSKLVVVVPAKRDGLSAIEAKISSLIATKLTEQSARVSLPKMHVVTELSLVPALRALGMKNAWCSDDAHPDFTGVGKAKNGEPICAESVTHKATIDVDEKGTTASAETRVHLVAKEGEHEDVLDVVADHPFVFAIEDASGEIAFLGRFVDPGGDAEAVPSTSATHHMKD